MPVSKQEQAFLRAAEDGDDKTLRKLIGDGVAVNARDPATGGTALHYAAANGARPALRVLVNSGRCDFMIRDKKGRLASELAGAYGRDPAMARLLLRKEVEQARTQRLQVTRRETRPEAGHEPHLSERKSAKPWRKPTRGRDPDRER